MDASGFADFEMEKGLQVPLEGTVESREAFKRELAAADGFELRTVYESWIDRIGANGITQSVQEVHPTCHDEGHDLGKVLYARLQDIPRALNTCESVCYSGCMHGVFMEAFATGRGADQQALGAWGSDEHADLEDIVAQAEAFCGDSEDYRVGDCIHGIGHAFMFLSDYDVKQGVEACDVLSTPALSFYCATGAYMELTENAPDRSVLGTGLSGLCEGAPYPAACFRNRSGRALSEHYAARGTFADAVRACLAMDGNDRHGCFYGLGVAHMAAFMSGQLTASQICQAGEAEDRHVCIEGLVERLARYHPEKAHQACIGVADDVKEICLAAADNGMYALDKSFEYYGR